MTGAKLFLPQWVDVLRALSSLDAKDRYYQKLVRNTETASSYVREVLRSLEEQGFLEVKRSSHIHRLVLTAVGNQLSFHLLEALRLLNYSSGSKPSTSKGPHDTPPRLQGNL